MVRPISAKSNLALPIEEGNSHFQLWKNIMKFSVILGTGGSGLKVAMLLGALSRIEQLVSHHARRTAPYAVRHYLAHEKTCLVKSSRFTLLSSIIQENQKAMFAFRYKPINFFFVFSCIQLFLGIKSIATASPIFSNCSAVQSFYNFTIGEEPDRIYGLFQCRGDINLEQCKSCLQTSSTEIKQTCPSTTQGVVWYDFCLVQYSDQNFFGLIQTDGFYFYNDKFSNKPYGQPDKALELVTNLLQQVPSRPFMFATAASPPDAIYSLVQCTMDVSKDGCKKCLQAVIQRIKLCCSSKRGWRYFAPSCSVRYETYLFFNGTKDREELERPYCPNDVSAVNLVFNTNLNQLLLTLTTNAPASGFFSSSFGHDPDLVYGLVLCRGDLDLTSCQECLNIAWNDLTEACPNKTQAILWYRRCQLRYSNESFFGTADAEGIYIANGVDDNIGNQSQSLEVIYRLVKTASEEKLMFASDELRVNESERRYYYAQCTRDLNSSACHDCLKELIQEVMKCCINKKGWIYLAASCNMRYEASAFLNINKVVPPVTQPNPSPQLIPATSPIPPKGVVPGNGSKEGKKAKNSRVLAIGISVAFLGFVLLGCCIFYLLCGRKKPKKERKQQQSQDGLLDNLGPPTGTDLLNTNISGGSQMETQELPLISLDTILHATNKFSFENKLGEGGFGTVYKVMIMSRHSN
ncbi:hypothetical protein MRB53_021307 [Persea americana]|uniref:Uncharacterized protein n=1 Tax=Persea americana TaxID=3435 RepID=A0ACC2L3U1_PERAE|nr:hypothetical protein MRB53_021307 [Persea americana]